MHVTRRLLFLWIVSAAAATAVAETAELEMKRLESRSSMQGMMPGTIDFYLRYGQGQNFFQHFGNENVRVMGPDGKPVDPKAAFTAVVKKEPAYQSKQPFFGVVTLGGKKYGFALDTATPDEKKEKPKEEAKKETKEEDSDADGKAETKAKPEASPAIAYDRLIFDVNGNGDLTDDKPVEAMKTLGIYPRNYANSEFPRVDLTLTVDEQKVEYAFFLRVHTYSSPDYSYASASLNSAAYREGEMTLEGKSRKIYLIDFNSNGRFDDRIEMLNTAGPNDRLYPQYGDLLMIDPQTQSPQDFNYYEMTYGNGRQLVSKLASIDGKFYQMEVSPAGNKLTLEPSKAGLGAISNPSGDFRALIYNDDGAILTIVGQDGKPAPAPEGEWKLLSYTIDLTAQRREAERKAKEEAEKKPKEGEKKEAKETSLLSALSKALGVGASSVSPSRVSSGSTMVQASATKASKAVKVVQGQTAEMAFGAPFKPVIAASPRSKGEAYLEMSLVGSAGEIVTNMTVDGGRPSEAPRFTIKDPKGNVAQEGKFEFG